MYLKSFVSILVGFCGGIGVAAGTFAFMVIIRIIPRLVKKANLEHKVIYIENIVVRGVLFAGGAVAYSDHRFDRLCALRSLGWHYVAGNALHFLAKMPSRWHGNVCLFGFGR